MVSGRRYYNHLKWRPAVYYSKRFRTQAGLVHYSLVQGHIPQFHPPKKKESIINQIMHTYFEQLSLVHTSYINMSNEIKTILLWELRRQNNENFSLFRLLFCSWLMLGLWSYAYAYDDPYVAGLTSFLCFAFCFCPYAYAIMCMNQALEAFQVPWLSGGVFCR